MHWIGNRKGPHRLHADVPGAIGAHQQQSTECVVLQFEVAGVIGQGRNSIGHVRIVVFQIFVLRADSLNQLHLRLVQPGIGPGFAQQIGVLADFGHSGHVR